MLFPLHEDPEKLAEIFHSTYENLAPILNYKTRKASAVPWKNVPETNKKLMIAVATIIQLMLQIERDRRDRYLIEYCKLADPPQDFRSTIKRQEFEAASEEWEN